MNLHFCFGLLINITNRAFLDKTWNFTELPSCCLSWHARGLPVMTKATVQHSLNGLTVQPEITQPQTKNNGSASVSAHTLAKNPQSLLFFMLA